LKGILFNVLEQTVVEGSGEEPWEDLLDEAGLDGIYTSLGSYPDEDLFHLVGAAAGHFQWSTDDVLIWAGRQAIPHFYALYPELFDNHSGTRAFVLTLNEVIHPEVRKLYPGADVPDFDFDDPDGDPMPLGYRSHRRMCTFAEGLVRGTGDHYGETVAIEHTECMHRGDPRCLLHLAIGHGQ